MSRKPPYRYIKLTVNENELDAFNQQSDIHFPIMDVNLTIHTSEEEKSCPSIKLHELDDSTAKFFAAVDEEYHVEIFFFKNKVTTKLPVETSLNLINFLKLYRPKSKSNYCCINFAYEMAYGRNKIVNDNDTEYFDELPSRLFSEEKLVPGDIVHLQDAKKINHHYAISIGQNYYLSLFGTVGPLIISTLGALKKGFEADTCVQAMKKRL